VKPAILFGLILLFFTNTLKVQSAVTGQIIADPANSRRLIYNGVSVNGYPKPVLLCGAGDPEDFFYHNTSQSLNTLITNKSKTTYITAYVKDNCSGCNPGTGTALDTKLIEWGGYLDQLENAGVTIVFFFFDDGYSMPSGWLTGDGPKIVNKLKNRKDNPSQPRKLLIWSVAEEYSEGLSDQQVKDIAAMIKANDANGHVIGVHQLPGTAFKFGSDSNLKMFLMQINKEDPVTMNADLNAAWSNPANAGKILNMAENIDHALDSRIIVRQRNWAAIMGGASIVQVHKMGGTGTGFNNDPAKYGDCNNLTGFMESTRVNFMIPNNTIKAGSTEWVLAEPGYSYILYTRNGGSPGLSGMTGGTYIFNWMDTVTGSKMTETKTVGTGIQTWAKPSSFENELALYLVKSTNPPVLTLTPTPKLPTSTPTPAINKPPIAQNQTVATGQESAVFIQLQFEDNDGPGPYTYTITQQPANGTLSGSNNDRTYTPKPGFTGTDSFKWKVNDGKADSNIATVSITVVSDNKQGDANGDGKVDGADYLIWLSYYGQSVTGPAKGDFNNSGKTDGADYLVWLSNYGK